VPLSRAEAQRRGRLILVAEDNEINQDVILQQLALLGQTADIASNGAEALALWQDGQYGLLISDLHMPRMDGYELTAAIRTAEAGGMRMPILAFTADALRGAAARCLAVGMDDYLAKPVQLVDLEAKLKKWLPGADLAVDVDVLKALIGADPALLREFLQDFRVGANRIAGQLRPACEARDPAAVVALVHKLKSSARSVGALRLGDHCARMEEAGLAGDSDAITALLPGFDSSMARVEEFLAQY
jgi:CheY-like chemotaxis protein